MGQPLLYITNGQTGPQNRVHLINNGRRKSGFFLIDWTPEHAAWKGGGIFADNPLAHGRRLVQTKRSNIIATFELGVNGEDQDIVIQDGQNLRRLLREGAQYWTEEFIDSPVYLVARGSTETNERYAVIHAYAVPRDDNPYAPPFYSDGELVAMEDFLLSLELGQWRDKAPGDAGTDLPVGTVVSYNSVNLGNTDGDQTNVNRVFFGNHHQEANLTHIYRFTGAVFTANLLTAALPWQLSTPGVNQYIAFGISTAVARSAPFSSIILDVAQAWTGTGIAGKFQYSDGLGGWLDFDQGPGSGIELFDETDPTVIATPQDHPFQNTGVNGIYFFPQSDWAPDTLNGVTAWWVRFLCTAHTNTTQNATQQNRAPYAVTWPYIEIDETHIEGDLEALLKYTIRNRSCADEQVREPQLFSDRILMGARSTERGDDFTAYLPLSDTGGPTWLTASVLNFAGHGTSTFEDSVDNAYLARCLQWDASAINVVPINGVGRLVIDSTVAGEFRGRYHAFIRCNQTSGNAGDIQVLLRVLAGTSASNLFYDAKQVSTGRVGFGPELMDMGIIDVPPAEIKPGETVQQITLDIRAGKNVATAAIIQFYDVILIPVDEWSIDTVEIAVLQNTHILYADNYLELDSLTFPRRRVYAPIRDIASDELEYTYLPINSDHNILRPRKKIRVWTLSEGERSHIMRPRISEHALVHSVAASFVQQYFGMRGDR